VRSFNSGLQRVWSGRTVAPVK